MKIEGSGSASYCSRRSLSSMFMFVEVTAVDRCRVFDFLKEFVVLL